MSVAKINKSIFDAEVRNTSGKALVDFYADWCGPCRMQAPIIDELSEALPGIKFYKVNVDENQELCQEFRIMSIPTIMIIVDGQIIYSQPGLVQKDQLIELLGV